MNDNDNDYKYINNNQIIFIINRNKLKYIINK